MCEFPANVVFADEFLRIFDGYSIGYNDLTQLTLGSIAIRKWWSIFLMSVTARLKRWWRWRCGGPPCRKENRYLRPGSFRLSGVRAVPGGGDRNRVMLSTGIISCAYVLFVAWTTTFEATGDGIGASY